MLVEELSENAKEGSSCILFHQLQLQPQPQPQIQPQIQSSISINTKDLYLTAKTSKTPRTSENKQL